MEVHLRNAVATEAHLRNAVAIEAQLRNALAMETHLRNAVAIEAQLDIWGNSGFLGQCETFFDDKQPSLDMYA